MEAAFSERLFAFVFYSARILLLIHATLMYYAVCLQISMYLSVLVWLLCLFWLVSATGGCRAACHQVSSVLNCNSLCTRSEVCVSWKCNRIVFTICSVCVWKCFIRLCSSRHWNIIAHRNSWPGRNWLVLLYKHTYFVSQIVHVEIRLTAELSTEVHVWKGFHLFGGKNRQAAIKVINFIVFWRIVVWYKCANVSEEYTVSVCKVVQEH